MKQLPHFLLIVLISITGTTGAYAQKESQALVDSLIRELPKQTEDTNKVKMLNELSNNYVSIKPDDGIRYGQMAVKLATKLEWKNGLARANNVLGNNYLIKSDPAKALEYYQNALKINEETGNKKGIASVTNNLGLLYLNENDNAGALEYFSKALRIHQEIGNKDGMAIACDNIGDIYRRQKNYRLSLQYYLSALQMNEDIGKKLGVALVTQSIGELYMDQKDYATAIAYMQKAIKSDEEIGDKLRLAWCLTNIGKAYLSMAGDIPAKSANDTINPRHVVLQHPVYPGTELPDKAIDYLKQGAVKAEEVQALDILEACYKNLADAYNMRSDYKQSLDYYKDYTTLKDSFSSKASSEKIARMEYDNKTKIITLEQQQKRNYTYAGMVVMAVLLCFSFFIIKERRRSEKLLLDILPAKVAAELKSSGTIKARQFDHVTVLFTDFAHFTKAQDIMSPQALIDELYTCFNAFDEITAKYSIEKIKTIGDAYLAVCGLPVADPKHAENVLMAAIEINAFMENRLVDPATYNSTFEIRIGIHSGSVVAGIVGVKKFSYDIWGDAVNAAARMEQNSIPGKINISETTYELVKDKFTCEYHGEIVAKNMGTLKMYFVSSAIALA